MKSPTSRAVNTRGCGLFKAIVQLNIVLTNEGVVSNFRKGSALVVDLTYVSLALTRYSFHTDNLLWTMVKGTTREETSKSETEKHAILVYKFFDEHTFMGVCLE